MKHGLTAALPTGLSPHSRTRTDPAKAGTDTPPNSRRESVPGSARTGFTFIEILATMTLLAIVLPSIMSGISLSLSTADYAKRQSQAAALGHSKLMELATDGSWQHDALGGDFGTDFPGYRWTAQALAFDGTLQQLDLTVTWQQPDGRARDVVTFSTLVQPPSTTASGGTE